MGQLVTFGETSLRLSPAEGARFETAEDLRLRVSGTESNVAAAASALGTDATWLSKLPDTALGRRVERTVRSHGVDTEVAWGEGGRQGLVFDERGAEPRAGRRYQDRSDAAAATVTPGELPMDRVQAADVTFVAGSTLALSGRIVETAEAVLRAAGSGLVAMDPDYRSGLWSAADARETLGGVFDAVDVLVADEADVETIFDRSGESQALAHTVASEHDFGTVVVLRDDGGALAVHDGVVHEQGGVETEVVDPAGSREAFTGAFIDRVLAGASPDEALAYGVASAALCRTLPGAVTTATRAEVAALAEDVQSRR